MDAALLDKFVTPALLMIVAAALGVGGREWVARARSGTKRIQAEDDAQVSVLADVRAERVAAVLREAGLLKQIEDLRDQLANAQAKLTIVQMLADSDPNASAQVALDSAFVDTHRPLRPAPRRAPPVVTDVFQAAEPYAPPKPGAKK